MVDNNALWAAHPIFAAAGPAVCAALAAGHDVEAFAAGEQISAAGDGSDRVLVLLVGTARVFHRTPDGRETVPRLLRAPATYGDNEALLQLPMLGGLCAVDDVLASWVLAGDFLALLEQHPAAALAQLRHQAASACVSARNEHQVFASLEQRVANVLLAYADLFGVVDSRGGVVIDHGISQQLVARSLGAAERSVRLVLRRWKTDGLLDKRGARYVLTSPRRVEELASVVRGGLCYQIGMSLAQLAATPSLPVAEVIEVTEGRVVHVGGELVVGREPGSRLLLPGEAVAPRHCRIYRGSTGGRYWLEDLGSEPGTLLNHRLVVRRAVLRDGDQIEVGGHVLDFRQRLGIQTDHLAHSDVAGVRNYGRVS